MSLANATIGDPHIRAAFERHPDAVRRALLRLRDLIVQTAAETPRVGELVETLKWGEPAYLPKRPRTGTTIRINGIKGSPDRYAVYFNCRTSLVEGFRARYPDLFDFDGNRAIVLSVKAAAPEDALKRCFAAALTYHL